MLCLWCTYSSTRSNPIPAAMPTRAAADEVENLEAEEPRLDPSSLAGMLENDVRIRNRLRFKEQGKLMRWVKGSNGAELVGQCSMASIALNVRALTILARYWCPKAKQVARSPSVDMVRKEARLKAKIPIMNILRASKNHKQ